MLFIVRTQVDELDVKNWELRLALAEDSLQLQTDTLPYSCCEIDIITC